MAPWFDLYTKESEVALFAVFGWKLRLLAYFAYYFTSSGQNWLFLSSTSSILDRIGKVNNFCIKIKRAPSRTYLLELLLVQFSLCKIVPNFMTFFTKSSLPFEYDFINRTLFIDE